MNCKFISSELILITTATSYNSSSQHLVDYKQYHLVHVFAANRRTSSCQLSVLDLNLHIILSGALIIAGKHTPPGS